MDLYDIAATRVEDDPTLRPYAEIIFYDWQQDVEYWHWIATAPSTEIVDWAQTVQQGEREQAAEDAQR